MNVMEDPIMRTLVNNHKTIHVKRMHQTWVLSTGHHVVSLIHGITLLSGTVVLSTVRVRNIQARGKSHATVVFFVI